MSASQPPALSVIVVSYNSVGLILRCLASVEKHLAAIPYEVLVVDNASADGTAECVRSRFSRVRLITNPRNAGFGAALNIGLRQTAAPYVLWLNPDAELLDDRFPQLLEYLGSNPTVGILGPQLVDPDGKRQLSCRSFPSYRTALFHRYSFLTRWLPKNPYSREYLHSDWEGPAPRDVDWVSGACFVHRRQVSEELGGLDERFFMYCEDVDFCLRARQRGWMTRYHPAARVLHRIGTSTRRERPRMILERHRSMWRYYLKHFRRNPVKDLAVGAALWARCGLIMLRKGE